MKTVSCTVCGAECRPIFEARVLLRHRVTYFHCAGCGFIRSEDPYWLEEAYRDVIAYSDTGLVARNVRMSRHLSAMYLLLDRGRGPYLDMAGGYGMLTRMMRDAGFDCYWDDPYARNLFARGFERRPEQRFVAASAVEVLEHVPDPLAFLRRCDPRKEMSAIVFTPQTYSGNAPPLPSWPYYGFDAGQHIAFYHRRTLREMARRLDMWYGYSRGIHVFSRGCALPVLIQPLRVPGAAEILARLARLCLGSRTAADNAAALRKVRESGATDTAAQGGAGT